MKRTKTPPKAMRRTKAPPPLIRRKNAPPGKKRMINYYDINRAQRWGTVIQEKKSIIIARTVMGDKVKVPRKDIICDIMMPK